MTARALFYSLFVLFVTGVAGPPGARAQSETTTQPLGPTSAQGPTRAASATTANLYLDDEPDPAAPRLMPRYRAFHREFVSDFGAPRIVDRVDPLLGLKARLEQRWGDSPLYLWLERGLALYTWVQASTQGETKGFDIKFMTGEMAGGKLGVHMSRPLGSGTVE